MHRTVWPLTAALVIALGGCASHSGHGASKPPKHPISAQLVAVDDSGVSGSVQVTRIPGGAHLQGRISGLTPGSVHALHLHAHGDCTAPNRGSAGGHFNPRGSEHGDPAGLVHHLGDIANQTADAQGVIAIDVNLRDVSVDSKLNDDVIGHALVLRAGPDDYTTQPDGGGGAAIACGVILKKE